MPPARPEVSRTILIVEDDEIMRLSLADRLKLEEFDVLSAATVDGVRLLLAHDHRPSLVISDMRLPDGSGAQVFELCRARLPGVPVIMMTAFASISDAVRLVKTGALDYLEKPFDLDEFIDVVRTTMSPPENAIPRDLRGSVEEAERTAIINALERNGWAISKTAAALAISRKNLWEKMRRYRIER